MAVWWAFLLCAARDLVADSVGAPQDAYTNLTRGQRDSVRNCFSDLSYSSSLRGVSATVPAATNPNHHICMCMAFANGSADRDKALADILQCWMALADGGSIERLKPCLEAPCPTYHTQFLSWFPTVNTTAPINSMSETSATSLISEHALAFIRNVAGFVIALLLIWCAVEYSKKLNPRENCLTQHGPEKSILHWSYAWVTLAYLLFSIFAFVVIPVVEQSNGLVSCTSGLPWEANVKATLVILLGHLIEIAYYWACPCKRFGFFTSAFCFVLSVMSKANLYTDVTFAFIAFECGSTGRPYTIASVVMLGVVVVFAQYVVPLVFPCCALVKWCLGKTANPGTVPLVVSLGKMTSMELLDHLYPVIESPKSSLKGKPSAAYLQAFIGCCWFTLKNFSQALIQAAFLIAMGVLNIPVLFSILIALILPLLNATVGCRARFKSRSPRKVEDGGNHSTLGSPQPIERQLSGPRVAGCDPGGSAVRVSVGLEVVRRDSVGSSLS